MFDSSLLPAMLPGQMPHGPGQDDHRGKICIDILLVRDFLIQLLLRTNGLQFLARVFGYLIKGTTIIATIMLGDFSAVYHGCRVFFFIPCVFPVSN